MKIFFVWSGSYQEALLVNNVPVMFSWINSRTDKRLENTVPEGYPEVMIDSGGYQLQSGIEVKKSINVEHYALWLRLILPKHPEVVAYMNLDIMGNLPATLKNQSYLESEGLKPLPVWHAADGDGLLKTYCEKYEWIALGGFASQGISKPGIRAIFNRIKQRHPDNKFHLLGIGLTGSTALRSFQPYSSDCSTWTAPVRFGTQIELTKDGLLKEVVPPKEERNRIRNDKEYRNQVLIEAVRKIKQFGTDLDKFSDPYQINLI